MLDAGKVVMQRPPVRAQCVNPVMSRNMANKDRLCKLERGIAYLFSVSSHACNEGQARVDWRWCPTQGKAARNLKPRGLATSDSTGT